MAIIEFHPHTADEKFTVTAQSLEEAFSAAVTACKEIMIGTAQPEPAEQQRFVVKGKRLRSVLYDFLNEIIAHLDEEHVLFTQAEQLTIQKDKHDDEYILQATLLGVNADTVDFRTVIKNMTYSDMEILENHDRVQLTVVVDI